MLERPQAEIETGGTTLEARKQQFDVCILKHLAKARADGAVRRLVRACDKIAR